MKKALHELWMSFRRFLALIPFIILVVFFAWPLDAQEVVVPLQPAIYVYSDTSCVHHAEYTWTRDSVSAEIKPYASISFALPKQPMREVDGLGRKSSDSYYHDSIGVWMSCPPGYTVTVATSWSENNHFEVGTFPGPFPYGLYWSPFHSSPYIDREYGGVIYATVEVHQTRGHNESYYYADIDAACFKYWKGTLSVDTQRSAVAESSAEWYTFPLMQQVRMGDAPFAGTSEDARRVLPPGMYVSQNGYKLAIGGHR